MRARDLFGEEIQNPKLKTRNNSWILCFEFGFAVQGHKEHERVLAEEEAKGSAVGCPFYFTAMLIGQ